MIDLQGVPKIYTVMHLVHSHPLEGHIRAENTLVKIQEHFYWLGIVAEVKNYVQRCPLYQLNSPTRSYNSLS